MKKIRDLIREPLLRVIDNKFVWQMPNGRLVPAFMGGDGNTLVTPDIVARLAYAALHERTMLPQLVYRDFEADFNGTVGNTITVRKPAEFTAKVFDRDDGIDIQAGNENSFSLTLDTILDVSFAVPAEEATLELADLNEQLVVPAVLALVEGIEARLLKLRDDVTAEVGYGSGSEVWSDPRVLIDAGKKLNLKKVPRTDRFAVVGPTIEAEWTKDPLFHEADKRGDTQGLQEAAVGRKFGFDTYSTTFVEEAKPTSGPGAQVSGDPTTEVGLAFHKSALALVARALALPTGADAASFGANGLGLRVVRDYDINAKQEIVSIDVLLGAKTLDPNRAVLIKGADKA